MSQMKQHTDEWFRARLGRATASNAEHWMSELRGGGIPAGRKVYRATLVLQRINRTPMPSYQSEAMRYGTEMEPEARAAYAFERNVDVTEVGFMAHPKIDMAGASPDGLIGDDGLVEFKCPQPHTHLETLLGGTIALRYFYQIQFQMAVTGRAWCDYVSYDRNYPERMRMMIIRVPRDKDAIARLEREVQKFLGEVADTVAALHQKYPMLEAA